MVVRSVRARSRGLILLAAITCLLAGACQRGGGDAGAPSQAQTSGEPIRGTITLSQAAQVQPGNVLYIIARSVDGMGPPTAVKRVENPRFPFLFAIGPQDAMVPGQGFAGPMQIKARLSRTGDAMPRPGDVEGFYPEDVEPGALGVDILLGQIR